MRHLVGEHGAQALIDGRVAWILEQRFGLERLRLTARGRIDVEFDAQLEAIHVAASQYRLRAGLESERSGSTSAPTAEVATPSEWMSTGQAAVRLRVSPRWVRVLVVRGDIGGEQLANGRWRIDRASVERYEG